MQVAGLGAHVPVRGYRFGRAGSSLQITGLNARVPGTSFLFLGAGSSLQVTSCRWQVWALRFQLKPYRFHDRFRWLID